MKRVEDSLALRLFAWGLLLVGGGLLILFSYRFPLHVWLPLLFLVPLALLVDSFTFQLAGGVYLSFETVVCLFCALLLGPVIAAWMASIGVLLDELFLLRRGPHVAARSAGMYALMWLVGGLAYQAVGGTFPLMQLEWIDLLRALFLFLVAALVNRTAMGIERLLRGLSLREYLVYIAPRTLLIEIGFVVIGAVMAVTYTRIGPIAVTLLMAVMLLALAMFRQLREVSQKLERRLALLGGLNYVGRLIGASLELDRLLDLVYEGVSNLFDASLLCIALYDPERKELSCQVLYDKNGRHMDQPHEWLSELAAYLVERRELVLARNAEEVGRLPVSPEGAGSSEAPQSVLGVLMMSKGRAVGAIVAQSPRPDAFAQEDQEAMMTLANQAAIALENVRLFREVEQSRGYLRAVLDAVDNALVVTDMSGRVRLINRAVKELFGLSEERALGYPLREVVRHPVLVGLAERIARGEVVGSEVVQMELDDGRALMGYLDPVIDPQRERIGYVIALADVTAIHELSELKSTMIRVASHDLRNPLHLAAGFFRILLDDLPQLSELQKDLAHRVQTNLDTIGRLIDELLNLERVEEAQFTRQEPVDMGAVAQEVVQSQFLRAELKRQRLWVEVEGGPHRVKGNRRMLAQALTNLVDNAIKYTPEGGEIEVRVRSEGKRVFLSVRDTGVGIPPEVQPRIFEQFFRARQPGTEEVSGTGVGLSLVQQIVQQHGGQVWVESEGIPGKGSTFHIALPAL